MNPLFIFVGGADRSGTTLLQRILVAHSNIVGGPQLSGNGYNLSYDLFTLYKKILSGYDANNVSVFAERETLKNNFMNFYLSFFAKLDVGGKKFISEKTTKNIEVAEALLDFFEDAIFINIYRDGRDVLSSHFEVAKRSGKNKKPNAGLLCFRWNEAIKTMYRIKENEKMKDRFYSVCYEDMITDPSSTLTSLFKFIGLPFEEHLLHPEKIENSAGLADGVWHLASDFQQSFNKEKIGKWKKHLSFATRMKANLLMADNLRKLGYEVSPIYSGKKK